VVQSLCRNTRFRIREDNKQSKTLEEINKGLGQGFSLSSVIRNICTDEAIGKWLKNLRLF
jgi:hypothetical protein